MQLKTIPAQTPRSLFSLLILLKWVLCVFLFWLSPLGRPQKADLAVGSFSITADRDDVIDFTTPFMYLGISIIYKRPIDESSDLFSFLQPLSTPVRWCNLFVDFDFDIVLDNDIGGGGGGGAVKSILPAYLFTHTHTLRS